MRTDVDLCGYEIASLARQSQQNKYVRAESVSLPLNYPPMKGEVHLAHPMCVFKVARLIDFAMFGLGEGGHAGQHAVSVGNQIIAQMTHMDVDEIDRAAQTRIESERAPRTIETWLGESRDKPRQKGESRARRHRTRSSGRACQAPTRPHEPEALRQARMHKEDPSAQSLGCARGRPLSSTRHAGRPRADGDRIRYNNTICTV